MTFSPSPKYFVTVSNDCGEIIQDDIIIYPPYYLDISTGVTNDIINSSGSEDDQWRVTKTPSSNNTNLPMFSTFPVTFWPQSNNANWITHAIDPFGNGIPAQEPITEPGYYDYSISFDNIDIATKKYKIEIDEISVDNSSVNFSLNSQNTSVGYINVSSLYGPFTIDDQSLFNNGFNAFSVLTSNVNHYAGMVLSGRITGYCRMGRMENPTIPESNNIIFEELIPEKSGKSVFDSKFIIVPNPSANGIFTVSGFRFSVGNAVTVYSVLGEEVFKSDINSTQSIFDISTQPRGIYFVKIGNGAEMSVQKIVYQ